MNEEYEPWSHQNNKPLATTSICQAQLSRHHTPLPPFHMVPCCVVSIIALVIVLHDHKETIPFLSQLHNTSLLLRSHAHIKLAHFYFPEYIQSLRWILLTLHQPHQDSCLLAYQPPISCQKLFWNQLMLMNWPNSYFYHPLQQTFPNNTINGWVRVSLSWYFYVNAQFYFLFCLRLVRASLALNGWELHSLILSSEYVFCKDPYSFECWLPVFVVGLLSFLWAVQVMLFFQLVV